MVGKLMVGHIFDLSCELNQYTGVFDSSKATNDKNYELLLETHVVL